MKLYLKCHYYWRNQGRQNISRLNLTEIADTFRMHLVQVLKLYVYPNYVFFILDRVGKRQKELINLICYNCQHNRFWEIVIGIPCFGENPSLHRDFLSQQKKTTSWDFNLVLSSTKKDLWLQINYNSIIFLHYSNNFLSFSYVIAHKIQNISVVCKHRHIDRFTKNF